NLDALVFDIQDIGTRFYTYISTMGLAMEAAAEANIKFFVLDRVNPIGGIAVEGFLPDGKQSFVAHHPIAVRHGMTVGELAKMFREEKSIGVDLTVIQLRGWKREWWQDEAGLPWINTSPNMRSLPAAGLYPGIGILERVVSIGRGTPTPFEWIGAPYIRGADLAREMNALRLPGILFEPASFTPTASVFKDQPCQGVRFVVIDRKALLPVRTGVALAVTLRRMYPESFDVAKLDLPAVSNELVAAIRSGQSLAAIVDSWKDDESQFGERRAKYLIY
ncbi:MAG TPA: DUF1343 domain-containing protein, partial [Thermoanaerobaculia bacterium]|nr:DUF1343 domain-containing protein [Thermoanaerobaculia bacterium]